MYYGYPIYPGPFYFVWFGYTPFIPLTYALESGVSQVQYCPLDNCSSNDKLTISSTLGNYAISTVLSNLTNITNVTVLNDTISRFGCHLDTADCVVNHASSNKLTLLTVVCIVFPMLFL